MPDFLELSIDKFTFRVAADRFYTAQGLWVKAEGSTVRTGLSDYLQGRSGDIAFAEVRPPGAALAPGDELAVIETIKVDISLGSPVHGVVLLVNPGMAAAPEVINQDPYGQGWIATLEPSDWQADRARLMDAEAYLAMITIEAESRRGDPPGRPPHKMIFNQKSEDQGG